MHSDYQRPGFTYALKRCEVVGAFFNSSILLALAVSIFLQSIERFIEVPEVEDPMLVLIVGCVGLALNVFCVLICHGRSIASAARAYFSRLAAGRACQVGAH